MPNAFSLIAVALTCLAITPAVAYDGAALYAEQCADCHGDLGQGTDYRRLPLVGDLPVRELTRVIEDTMPEGDADSCVDAEATAIAQYVYDAFYSPSAQTRLNPPRRELARLTSRQLEQSLVDLVGAFHGRTGMPDDRGLRVSYSSRRRTEKIKRHRQRVEPRLDLKLSELGFLPEEVRQPPTDEELVDYKKSAKRLDAIVKVRGGLFAPQTGLYDIRVESPNGFLLTFNGEPLLDGNVRTGDATSLSATVHLVGGRVYPLVIEARRTREPDLELTLYWKPPGGVEEVIPSRVLSPKHHRPLHVTGVRFPPDDRSVGFVRGSSVSAAWDEASTNAAIETAQAVLSQLPRLVSSLPSRKGRKNNESPSQPALTREEAISLCERLGEYAFRRPLTDDESRRFVTRYFAGAESGANEEKDAEETVLYAATELSLLTLLKSPQFLYPEAGLLDAPDDLRRSYAAASRLALGLWDSLPDRGLRTLAGQGKLAKRRVVYREARRMLNDDRTRTKLTRFFEAWFRLDHVADLSRDPEAYPDFDARIAADMRASLELALEDLVWEGRGDFRQLFLTKDLHVNARLADFLEMDRPSSGDPEDFLCLPADTPERVGVVSHPLLVTAFSYYRETSPIHRGVFLARNVLGRSLRPPPEAVAPLAPELAPEMTTRDRVATQTSPGACQSCHVLINDLGFTLEHFDAVGRFRHRDEGRPIDATGGYIATDGDDVRLNGARDLAEFLANSEDVHRAFVTQLFEHLTKQPPLAYGEGTVDRLLEAFEREEYRIRPLIVEIVVTAALAD